MDGNYSRLQGVGAISVLEFVSHSATPKQIPPMASTTLRLFPAGYTPNASIRRAQRPRRPNETVLKSLSAGTPTHYCNVCGHKIDGIDGFQGGAPAASLYFPRPHHRRVVLRAHEMQVANTTLPHEMGHTFTLYHPFEAPAGHLSHQCQSKTDGDIDTG